ncbi:hypothetical protein EV198_3553 [Roseivirga ehrenbergii]|uniref:Restriction endonuclease n=1 Tax=Roseivirga ehrenbergii (strain DSM 102268 / JCM 13514 / KCTC 12282 / NCIMB 14502 / KMM 6017) TaxID=279360 RepID=A0A150WXF0_ROSEK|nr:hypothetical protein [Roseivirga ehrenbergii]KYG71177.1 hypothetical protein MB14_12115 [Roseivirga ehrenbergii]TCK99025.1 hypothetical protein EV198_3553 [Roseivirga ehrenbergii]
MLADRIENIGNGNLSEGVEIDASIKAVIEFIETHFSGFSEKVKGEITASEKALTDKLCKYFNRVAGPYPFFFHHENVENHSSGMSPQIDIGTLSREEQITVGDRNYAEFDSFFSIEAKRLPTPGQNREKEYVIGHDKPTGGIERFKKGIHGKRLGYAAIIGYVQKEDFDFWFLQINDWIEELVKTSQGEWIVDDKLRRLTVQNGNQLAKFQSDNIRLPAKSKTDKIKLLHFWITLVD